MNLGYIIALLSIIGVVIGFGLLVVNAKRSYSLKIVARSDPLECVGVLLFVSSLMAVFVSLLYGQSIESSLKSAQYLAETESFIRDSGGLVKILGSEAHKYQTGFVPLYSKQDQSGL